MGSHSDKQHTDFSVSYRSSDTSAVTVNIKEEWITAEEYTNFLKRTDLGAQYPRERFEESRVDRMDSRINWNSGAPFEREIIGTISRRFTENGRSHEA